MSLWVTYFESQTSPLSLSFKAFPVRGSSNFTSAARRWWVLNTWLSENGWSASGFLRFWTNSLDIFGIDSDDSEGESGLKCLANIGDLIHRDISRWLGQSSALNDTGSPMKFRRPVQCQRWCCTWHCRNSNFLVNPASDHKKCPCVKTSSTSQVKLSLDCEAWWPSSTHHQELL